MYKSYLHNSIHPCEVPRGGVFLLTRIPPMPRIISPAALGFAAFTKGLYARLKEIADMAEKFLTAQA